MNSVHTAEHFNTSMANRISDSCKFDDKTSSNCGNVQNVLSHSKVEGDTSQNDSAEWLSHVDKNLWHQLCRLCAKRNDNIIPIYDDEGLEHELGSKLSDIFPFEISENDGFPKYCCDLCASIILSWNNMISYSKIANEKLNNMLGLYLSGSDSAEELIEADHKKVHDTNDNERESHVVNELSAVTNIVDENNTSANPCEGVSAGNKTEGDSSHLVNNNEIEVVGYAGAIVESSLRSQISESSDTSDKNNCDSVVHNQNDDCMSDHDSSDQALSSHDNQCNDFAFDFSNGDLTAVDDRSADGERTMSEQNRLRGMNKLELQAYKFHMPLKYITVNGYQFLRTKVFGFEPCSIPDDNMDVTSMFFKCCLCESVVQDINVIAHSKSHYPLKMTDSCKICHFAFGSIKCFRIHLKRHTIFIDEEYRKPARSLKVLKLEEDLKNIVESEQSDKLTRLSEEIDPLNVSNEEALELLNRSQKQITECSDGLNLLVKPDIFICEYCGNSYRFNKTLYQHIKRAHLSPFACKTCKKKFPSKLSLVKHRCVQIVPKQPGSKVKWLNCKCKKIFLFEEQYLEHVKSCEKAKYLPCKQCGREFPDKLKLEMHVSRQHIKLKELGQRKASVWICEICGCHLSAVSARKHYITHSFFEKKFSCSICEMKFSGKSALEKHVQSHSDARPFVCSICKATFKRKDHLKIHMKNKHNEFVDKKYECRKCKRRFTTQSYLIRHQRLHSQGVSYECAVCLSRYPTEHSLKMHQTRTKHDSMKEPSDTSISLNSADWANRFRCTICNRRYGSITSLKKHKSIHHKNAALIDEVKEDVSDSQNVNIENGNKTDIVENVYECSQCHRRYLSEFGLKLHLSRSKHAPTKVIPKKKCKLIGVRKGEKNPRFQCNVCKEMFSSLLSLKMHKIKRKHFSKCPNCDKRFALDFKLRNHLIKVHRRNDIDEKINEFTPAEIMPYQCEFCEQKFAMQHNYLAHVERKHKNQNETTAVNYIYIDSNVFKQEITNGETPVVYHCIECWDNFFTEEEFHNHSHDNKDVVASTTEFDNIATSQITEPSNYEK